MAGFALIDQSGDLRCPRCHARNSLQRKWRLLTGRQSRCIACGAMVLQGKPRAWTDPEQQQLAPQPVAAAAPQAGSATVYLTATKANATVTASLLLGVVPGMSVAQRQQIAARVGRGERTSLTQLPAEQAHATAERLTELGITAEVE